VSIRPRTAWFSIGVRHLASVGVLALSMLAGPPGPAQAAGAGGDFAPPSAGTPTVTNPSRVAPALRNAPSAPTRVEIRNQPSHPVNRQLRLTAPELATPTPGVPPPPIIAPQPQPSIPPLLNH
jgi:hypothetical protein